MDRASMLNQKTDFHADLLYQHPGERDTQINTENKYKMKITEIEFEFLDKSK